MVKSIHFHTPHKSRWVQCSHCVCVGYKYFSFFFLFTFVRIRISICLFIVLCAQVQLLMWIQLILEASGSWSTITSCTVGIMASPYLIGREHWEYRNGFNERGLGMWKVLREMRVFGLEEVLSGCSRAPHQKWPHCVKQWVTSSMITL